jgi:membrane associated rhomboid family serine protease
MNQFYLLRKIPLTLVLIVISVLVAIVSKFGSNFEVLYPFFITKYVGVGLPEIMDGEVWRLITPIFIHFGAIHILFNMLWLFDLGGVVEVRQGSPRLGILVGVIAVISNLAQFYYGGPSFGGMSGVVYGLLAYIWVQGKLNPRFGLQLHQYIVYMMLIWFVVCWTGLLGPIANMAHTMGLVMGLILGWAFSPNKKLPI